MSGVLLCLCTAREKKPNENIPIGTFLWQGSSKAGWWLTGIYTIIVSTSPTMLANKVWCNYIPCLLFLYQLSLTL